MPEIPRNIIDEIISANDIVDVIGSYFPLQRAGTNYKALSPFKKEKTASFFVTPSKQIFHCFSTQQGGDVIKFVMLYENVDFMTAVRQLAERANIQIPEDGHTDNGEASQKALLYKVLEDVSAFYQRNLHKEPEAEGARQYLTKRGLTSDQSKLFALGFSPESWDATLRHLCDKGHSLGMIEMSGLAVAKTDDKPEAGKKYDTTRYYDRFRGRLMFPICNESGKVVGFSARTLDSSAKEAKYVNFPESPLFHKSKVLFGLDKTKRAVNDVRRCIICEGQVDLISIHQSGIQNVVATMGTAFTEFHAQVLKRFADEVVLCFDSDAAGKNAAMRSIDHLLEVGLAVTVAEIPAPDDPDSLIRTKGADAFREIINRSRDYFDFLLDFQCQKHNPATAAGKMNITKGITEALVKVHNSVHRSDIMRKVAARLQVDQGALLQEYRKAARQAQSHFASGKRENKPETSGIEEPTVNRVQEQLVGLFLHKPVESMPSLATLNTGWIEPTQAGLILQKMKLEGRILTTQELLSDPQLASAQNLITRLLSANLPFGVETNYGSLALNLILRLEADFTEKQLMALRQEMASQKEDADQKTGEEIFKLTLRLQELVKLGVAAKRSY